MASIIPIENNLIGGAIVIDVFALLSAFALVSILLRMIWLQVHHRLSGGDTRSTEYAFFTTNLGCYAACLSIANMLNAVSGLISLKWLVMRTVRDGWACKLQVAMMQLGNWSTAFFTVAIALHTFNSLVLRVRQSLFICGVTILFGWISAVVAALIPVVVKPDIYGPTEISCNFNPMYPTAKFLLHVLPILLGALFSAGLYSIIFLVLRGTLSIKDGIKFSVDPTARWSEGTKPESYRRFVAKVARAMLWFPVVYNVLLVPYSIVQLLTISGFHVVFAVLVVASVLWFLLGIVNVLLTYNIFRVLEPAIDSPCTTRPADASLLPIHRDFRTPESQWTTRLSEKERASSLYSNRSKISDSTVPSQYSQSTVQHEQASAFGVNNIMSRVPSTVPVGRHIIPPSEIISPHLPGPKGRADVQPISPRQPLYDLAELKGLPPSPRPGRIEPLRPLRTRPRVWTTTVAEPAVPDNDDDDSPTPLSAGSTGALARGGRPALSAVISTVPRPLQLVASPSSIHGGVGNNREPPSSHYYI
ncbi:hypothetical protein AX15_005835 [Amanita polypyramis BW_CC]|nr:hypothetical protein AX15_005835 [Amanita polypyramis BW_CC]